MSQTIGQKRNSSTNSKEGGVEDYRGITLTQMTYKINTSILAKSLRTEDKRKAILVPTEIQFETGMGTMNNIYVLNYRIIRQVERERENSNNVC